MFKIGEIEIATGAILGPMAGITDKTYRALCMEQGASLCYSEMISAKGLHYKNSNTRALLETKEDSRPFAIQLFGSDPDIMAEEAVKLQDGDADLFDINMGCPMPKIVNNGEGSALMRDPQLVARIVRTMADRLKKPLTIKIRKGFNDSEVNAPLIAKIAQDNGAAAICVHGRTREQYYSGKADWDIIREVKNAVSIPVIGSGDVCSASDAKAMLEETGCDGVMIARAACGNPWIFREVKEYLEMGEIPARPDKEEIKKMILRQLEEMTDAVGEWSAVRQMRKHAGFYFAGHPNAASMRRRINTAEDAAQFKHILTMW